MLEAKINKSMLSDKFPAALQSLGLDEKLLDGEFGVR